MKKILSLFTAFLLLCGCGLTAQATGTGSVPEIPETAPVTETAPDGTSDASFAVPADDGGFITLSDKGSSFTGTGVTLSGSTVTITNGGKYTVTGTLENGQLVIAAPKSSKVELTMDGAEISCDHSAALYVQRADKLVITLAEGSKNALRSTGSFVQTDDSHVDAALFSKEDLTIKGNGALEISCEAGHGIVSKDDLKISGGTVTVTAADKGISSNDSLTVKGGSLNVISSDDALNCDGDVTVSGGELTLSTEDDGIHSDSTLSISGGKITVIKSYEGLEGLNVNISGGDISVRASDDGINSAGGNSSSFGPAGGDSFGHGYGARPDDGELPDDRGNFFDYHFGGGSKSDNPDEGVGGAPPAGFGQMPQPPEGGDPMEAFDTAASITISGGNIVIDADGDGIDSNGALYISGGSVTISGPVNGGNSAMDYETSGCITGGSIIACGSADMAMNFGSDSTQGSILYIFPQQMRAGTEVALVDADGHVLAFYAPKKAFSSILISVPGIEADGTYTLTAAGSAEEIRMNGILYGTGGMGGHGGMRPGSQPPPGMNGGFGKRK